MLYRVRIDLAFNDEVDADKIFGEAEKLFKKAIKITQKEEPTADVGFVELHKCYHDEEPTKPCEIIKRIEV